MEFLPRFYIQEYFKTKDSSRDEDFEGIIMQIGTMPWDQAMVQ